MRTINKNLEFTVTIVRAVVSSLATSLASVGTGDTLILKLIFGIGTNYVNENVFNFLSRMKITRTRLLHKELIRGFHAKTIEFIPRCLLNTSREYLAPSLGEIREQPGVMSKCNPWSLAAKKPCITPFRKLSASRFAFVTSSPFFVRLPMSSLAASCLKNTSKHFSSDLDSKSH